MARHFSDEWFIPCFESVGDDPIAASIPEYPLRHIIWDLSAVINVMEESTVLTFYAVLSRTTPCLVDTWVILLLLPAMASGAVLTSWACIGIVNNIV